ncbi:hypothetical protein D3C75_1216360 [compost metagenome]
MKIVADKKTLTLQLGCDLRGFAAWSGTQIEYTVARLYIKQLNRCHGARLLNVI